jgi:hypothetical protein
MTPEAIIKAYRVPGGAIVRVMRNGRTRRYRIGPHRFKALSRTINLSKQRWSGFFGRSTLDATRWSA